MQRQRYSTERAWRSERLLPDIWKQSHPEAIRACRQEERRDKADRKQYNAARRRKLRRQLLS